jgi:hypothetical protein
MLAGRAARPTAQALSVARLVPQPVPPLVAGSAAAKPAEPPLPSVALYPVALPTALPAARRVAHATPPRVSRGSSLAEQVQSLDRARVALAAGDSSSALREIARYRAAWPDGVFLTEASVLEVEALAARGERSLAATRAAAFVAAHPDSPQADRLRALIPSEKRLGPANGKVFRLRGRSIPAGFVAPQLHTLVCAFVAPSLSGASAAIIDRLSHSRALGPLTR